MLLLLETAAGFALFKVLKEKKIKETKVKSCEETSVPGLPLQFTTRIPLTLVLCVLLILQDLWKDFETLEKAEKVGWGYALI